MRNTWNYDILKKIDSISVYSKNNGGLSNQIYGTQKAHEFIIYYAVRRGEVVFQASKTRKMNFSIGLLYNEIVQLIKNKNPQ